MVGEVGEAGLVAEQDLLEVPLTGEYEDDNKPSKRVTSMSKPNKVMVDRNTETVTGDDGFMLALSLDSSK